MFTVGLKETFISTSIPLSFLSNLVIAGSPTIISALTSNSNKEASKSSFSASCSASCFIFSPCLAFTTCSGTLPFLKPSTCIFLAAAAAILSSFLFSNAVDICASTTAFASSTFLALICIYSLFK